MGIWTLHCMRSALLSPIHKVLCSPYVRTHEHSERVPQLTQITFAHVNRATQWGTASGSTISSPCLCIYAMQVLTLRMSKLMSVLQTRAQRLSGGWCKTRCSLNASAQTHFFCCYLMKVERDLDVCRWTIVYADTGKARMKTNE